jgi:hypothetical protein
MIYLANLTEITSTPTRVCVHDVMDRSMTKPAKKMMADLRNQIRRFRQTLPGIVTETVK